MTAAARVTQDDIKRTLKAIVRDAEIGQARVIIRLEKSEIEIIIGATPEADEPAAPASGNPWDSLLDR